MSSALTDRSAYQVSGLLANLIDAISAQLSDDASEAFAANIKETYKRMPLRTLIQGSAPPSKVCSLMMEAFQDLKLLESKKELASIPWFELTQTLLKTLAKACDQVDSSSRTMGELSETAVRPRTQRGSKDTKVSNRPTGNGSRQSSTKKATTSEVKSPPPKTKVEAKQVPIPDTAKTQEIYQQVRAHLYSSGSAVYRVPGQSYIKCSKTACSFCREMFINMHLSSCEHFGHSPCISAGWFPHVGVGLWKILRKDHDADEEFKPKASKPKPTELLCLRQSTSSPATEGTTSAAAVPETIIHGTKRQRSESLSGPFNWADEAERQE